MTIAQNDVNVIAVETNDQDFQAGAQIDLKVRAEVGGALFNTGGKYQVRLTMTDITNPTLVDSQNIVGNYGDARWPNAGANVFDFSVPAAATAGKAGDLLQPQARLVGNAAAPFDNSFAVGDILLLTP